MGVDQRSTHNTASRTAEHFLFALRGHHVFLLFHGQHRSAAVHQEEPLPYDLQNYLLNAEKCSENEGHSFSLRTAVHVGNEAAVVNSPVFVQKVP